MSKLIQPLRRKDTKFHKAFLGFPLLLCVFVAKKIKNMIIDTLDNADKYINLHPRFAKAFEFIKSQNLETMEPGKFEIDGKDIHASVSLKDGVTRETAKAEAHNNYIDIQVCPGGKEELGWKPRSKSVSPKEDYNARSEE